MKKIYMILAVCIILLGFQVSKADERLKLLGKITSIQLENKEDSLLVSIRLKMSFQATGNVPVLLWKQTYPHDENLRGRFLGTFSKIFGMLPTEKEEKILYYHSSRLPSIQRTQGWQDIKKELDSEILQSTQIQSIKSGETLDFDAEWSFIFLKKKANGSNDPLWGYSSHFDVLSNEIKTAKNLSLQVTYRVWSSELELHSDRKDKKPFGKKLQKRWKKYGYLWLDDIVSEPIPLDLSSAVVKTESKL